MILEILKILVRHPFYFIFRNPRIIIFLIRNSHSYIHKNAIIEFKNKDSIVLEKKVYIGAFTVIIVANSTFPESYMESYLFIGSRTYIGEGNNIRAAGGIITIGKDCLISQQVTIVASNHNIQLARPIREQGWSTVNNFVKINDDVWIGAGSIILPGVTIGKGAVVAAGSIVTKDIPEYAIAAGNPARVLKFRQ